MTTPWCGGSVKAHISGALGKLGLDNGIQLALLAHDAYPVR